MIGCQLPLPIFQLTSQECFVPLSISISVGRRFEKEATPASDWCERLQTAFKRFPVCNVPLVFGDLDLHLRS